MFDHHASPVSPGAGIIAFSNTRSSTGTREQIRGALNPPSDWATTTNFPPKTFAEFIDYAKAHPGDVRYASAGIGAYQHVNTEILAKRAGGLQLIHIPFKDGGSGILRDVAGGDTHVSWFNVTNPVGMIKAGKVRPLAVAAPQRLAAWPDVPTRVLVGRDDRLFPADFQRRVARERLGIEADEIDGGHLVALSEPELVVERFEAYRTAGSIP